MITSKMRSLIAILTILITKTHSEIALGSSLQSSNQQVAVENTAIQSNSGSESPIKPEPEDDLSIVSTVNVLENGKKVLFALDYFQNQAIMFTIYKDDGFIFKVIREQNQDSLSSTSIFKIQWYGQDITLKNKFEVQGNYLFVKNAELQDEAKYGCHYEIMGARHGENIVNKKLAVVRTPEVQIDTRNNLIYLPKIPKKAYKVARCSAKKAKPAADLEFFYESSFGNPENWRVEELQRQDDGVDVYSHIEVYFSVTPDMNNTVLGCRVINHPALELDLEFKTKDSIKKLTLDIEYPPQNTQITAISRTELKCSADANPAATYSWWDGTNMLDSEQEKLNLTTRNEILERNQTITCQASNIRGKEKVSNNPNLLMAAYEEALAMTDQGSLSIVWVLVIALVIMIIVSIAILAVYKFTGQNNIPQDENNGYAAGQEYTTDEEKQALQDGYVENGQNIHVAKAGMPNAVGSPSNAGMNTFDRRIQEHSQQTQNESLERDTYGNPQENPNNQFEQYHPNQNNMSFNSNPQPETIQNNDTQNIVEVKTPTIDEAIYDHPNIEDPNFQDKMYFDDPTMRPK